MEVMASIQSVAYRILRAVLRKLLCSTVLTGLLSFISSILLYYYVKHKFDYWKIRNVPYIKPYRFLRIVADVLLMRTSSYNYFSKMYIELGNHKFGGIFHVMKPALLIRDPDIIHKVLVTDYTHFFDRTSCVIDRKCFPLSNHLYSMQSNNKQSKVLREKLSPLFAECEIKKMFHVFVNCSYEVKNILTDTALKGLNVEFKDVTTRFTTDVFGLYAFGLNIDSLKNPDTKFRKFCRQYFSPSYKLGIRKFLKVHMPSYYYGSLGMLLKDSEIEEFFLGIIKAAVSLRRRNGTLRNDMLQYLINIRYKEKNSYSVSGTAEDDEIDFSDNDVAAQCYLFFLVASELTSSLLSFCLFELAVNPDIQSHLEKEVKSVFKNYAGVITYEALQEMKYLDKVINETLRKYPPIGNLQRFCTKRYTLPEAFFELEEGVPVVIPVYAIHHDSKYYPDPEVFNPERFNNDNVMSRPYYSYLPYGGGPRGCIGSHFSQIQAKVCLAFIVSSFELQVCNGTSIPLHLEPKALFMSAVGGITLRAKFRYPQEININI